MTRGGGIAEHDVVRVVRLARAERDFDGTGSVVRAPRIGDEGTVVLAYAPSGPFAVECVDRDGLTIWLADFSADELEHTRRAPRPDHRR